MSLCPPVAHQEVNVRASASMIGLPRVEAGADTVSACGMRNNHETVSIHPRVSAGVRVPRTLEVLFDEQLGEAKSGANAADSWDPLVGRLAASGRRQRGQSPALATTGQRERL